MVTIVYVNHLKPRRVEFFQYIFKKIFNKKSENINSSNFQMIFALLVNVCMRRSHVIVEK